MEVMSLQVQTRDKSKKAKDLLAQNIIPIEFYGKGVENQSFQVDYQTFRRLYRVAGGNTVVAMDVDGKKKMNVLVHDVKYHPVTDSITHIDVINVKMDQEIHTSIPLSFVGTASVVKEQGGTVTHNISELEVKCLPKDLVHEIQVDLSPIVDYNTSIHVSDIKVPGGIQVLNNPEDVVVSASAPRVETEETDQVSGAELEEKAEAKEESGE